ACPRDTAWPAEQSPQLCLPEPSPRRPPRPGNPQSARPQRAERADPARGTAEAELPEAAQAHERGARALELGPAGAAVFPETAGAAGLASTQPRLPQAARGGEHARAARSEGAGRGAGGGWGCVRGRGRVRRPVHPPLRRDCGAGGDLRTMLTLLGVTILALVAGLPWVRSGGAGGRSARPEAHRGGQCCERTRGRGGLRVAGPGACARGLRATCGGGEVRGTGREPGSVKHSSTSVRENTLESPQNVEISIIDDNYTLMWSSPESVRNVTFSAEYKMYETNWSGVPGCQHITGTRCDFSLRENVYEDIDLHIRAQKGNSTSPWSKVYSFIPFKKAQIGPPEVHLKAEDKAIIVNISPHGMMWALAWHEFTYNLVIWKNSSSMEVSSILASEERTLTVNPRDKIYKLSPATTYCLKVRAKYTLGSQNKNASYSPVYCINTTAENKLPPPENLQLEAKNQSYVLKWDYLYEGITFQAKWIPSYLKETYGSRSREWRQIPGCKDVKTTQCVFPQKTFPNGIHYYVRVQASRGNDTSFWSREKQFDTKAETVIFPPSIIVRPTGQNSLRVSISSPKDSENRLVERAYDFIYEIVYWENNSDASRTVLEKADFTIWNLKALTVYCVKAKVLIKEHKKNNSSVFSAPECGRTMPGTTSKIIIIVGILTALFCFLIVIYSVKFLLKSINYVFFPSNKPPSAINEYVSEQPLANLLLFTSEEQTERCFIIENSNPTTPVEENNQIGEVYKKYSSQTSEDSGNYSNEDENNGHKTSDEFPQQEAPQPAVNSKVVGHLGGLHTEPEFPAPLRATAVCLHSPPRCRGPPVHAVLLCGKGMSVLLGPSGPAGHSTRRPAASFPVLRPPALSGLGVKAGPFCWVAAPRCTALGWTRLSRRSGDGAKRSDLIQVKKLLEVTVTFKMGMLRLVTGQNSPFQSLLPDRGEGKGKSCEEHTGSPVYSATVSTEVAVSSGGREGWEPLSGEGRALRTDAALLMGRALPLPEPELLEERSRGQGHPDPCVHGPRCRTQQRPTSDQLQRQQGTEQALSVRAGRQGVLQPSVAFGLLLLWPHHLERAARCGAGGAWGIGRSQPQRISTLSGLWPLLLSTALCHEVLCGRAVGSAAGAGAASLAQVRPLTHPRHTPGAAVRPRARPRRPSPMLMAGGWKNLVTSIYPTPEVPYLKHTTAGASLRKCDSGGLAAPRLMPYRPGAVQHAGPSPPQETSCLHWTSSEEAAVLWAVEENPDTETACSEKMGRSPLCGGVRSSNPLVFGAFVWSQTMLVNAHVRPKRDPSTPARSPPILHTRGGGEGAVLHLLIRNTAWFSELESPRNPNLHSACRGLLQAVTCQAASGCLEGLGTRTAAVFLCLLPGTLCPLAGQAFVLPGVWPPQAHELPLKTDPQHPQQRCAAPCLAHSPAVSAVTERAAADAHPRAQLLCPHTCCWSGGALPGATPQPHTSTNLPAICTHWTLKVNTAGSVSPKRVSFSGDPSPGRPLQVRGRVRGSLISSQVMPEVKSLGDSAGAALPRQHWEAPTRGLFVNSGQLHSPSAPLSTPVSCSLAKNPIHADA
ncbi:Interferon alpha/beta receptor 1, partial [Galemys pyrenaicus]